MILPGSPRAKRPPRRRCRGCGGHVHAWIENPLCTSCGKADAKRNAELPAPTETLREFRRRVIDPTRNDLQGS